MLLALAFLQPTHASRIMTHPGDGVRISTPYGQAFKYQARAICGSQHVFIGVITTVSSRYRDDEHRAIVSDLDFEVEHVLYGEPPPVVTLTVSGGALDGRVVSTDRSPQPTPGIRYLMAYSLLKQTFGLSRAGDPIITESIALPSHALAPEQSLRDELDTFCREQALLRYHDVMPTRSIDPQQP